jgi:hypothetical protein
VAAIIDANGKQSVLIIDRGMSGGHALYSSCGASKSEGSQRYQQLTISCRNLAACRLGDLREAYKLF